MPKIRLYAGRLRLRLIPDRGKATLTKFATENIEPGTTVKADNWPGYNDLWMWYEHQPVMIDEETKGLKPSAVKAAKGEKMSMIHLVFSYLKTWIMCTHHGVSPQHLQAYLNEFVFRFNRRFYPMTAFNAVLGIGTVTTAPTYRGLYDGVWAHPNPAEE
jgi:hypothetical protein